MTILRHRLPPGQPQWRYLAAEEKYVAESDGFAMRVFKLTDGWSYNVEGKGVMFFAVRYKTEIGAKRSATRRLRKYLKK